MQMPGLSVKPANCAAFSFSFPQQRASLRAWPLMGARNERCCGHHFSGRPYSGGSVVNAPHLLKPNVADISAHLHALFPHGFVHGFPDAQIEIVHASPGILNKSRWFSAFDVKDAAVFAESKNAEGDNVYVGAALRRGPLPPSGRAKTENYLAAQCAWCEYDGAGDHERIVAICREKNLLPAIIITTGTVPNLRQHLYFRLKGAVTDPEEMKAINAGLRDLFGSDDVADAIRVMRLGGCVNYPKKEKRELGYVAELIAVKVAQQSREYSIDVLPKPQHGQFNGATRQSGLGFKYARTDDEIWNLLQASKFKNWHNSMRDAIATMIGRDWSDDAIRFSCAPYCKGGKDDPDLDPLINGARQKWNKPDPDNDNASLGQPNSLIVSSSEFLAGFVPPDYLIDGLLQRGFLYAFTAPTGTGKTALALLIMALVARGKPLGEYEIEKGRVLYLAGENPDDVRMRWMAMSEHAGFDINNIDVHFLPGVFKLSEIGARIVAEVEKIGPVALVVIDTSAAYYEGSDENDNVQMGSHARNMRNLLARLPGRPCGLICCHPIKNAAADNLLPRGGGAFIAEVDGNLTAMKSDSLVTLHWQGKFRGPDFAPIPFTLKTVTTAKLKDSKDRLIPTVIAESLTEQEQHAAEASSHNDEDTVLIALLNSETGILSMMAVADACKWLTRSGSPNKSRVQRAADRLKKSKLVVSDRDGLNLTAKGKKAAEKAKYNAATAGASYG
jgi:hypothetical protein